MLIGSFSNFVYSPGKGNCFDAKLLFRKRLKKYKKKKNKLTQTVENSGKGCVSQRCKICRDRRHCTKDCVSKKRLKYRCVGCNECGHLIESCPKKPETDTKQCTKPDTLLCVD